MSTDQNKYYDPINCRHDLHLSIEGHENDNPRLIKTGIISVSYLAVFFSITFQSLKSFNDQGPSLNAESTILPISSIISLQSFYSLKFGSLNNHLASVIIV